MVGINTVIADDPLLTVRDVTGPQPNSLRRRQQAAPADGQPPGDDRDETPRA